MTATAQKTEIVCIRRSGLNFVSTERADFAAKVTQIGYTPAKFTTRASVCSRNGWCPSIPRMGGEGAHMTTGTCDCCGAENVDLSFTVFAGLETWSCSPECPEPIDIMETEARAKWPAMSHRGSLAVLYRVPYGAIFKPEVDPEPTFSYQWGDACVSRDEAARRIAHG